MELSVIIPNLNSPLVDRTIASLYKQTYRAAGLEIIVVGLDEPGLVPRDEDVRFISTKQPVCAAAARNIGIEEAKGRFLVFIDADCVAASYWLDKLMARHRQGEDVVGGSVAFTADNYWTLCDNISMFHEFLPSTKAGPRPYLPTLNLSVRREVAREVGKFDESFPGASGEDIDWTIRIRQRGYRLYFEPQAVVYHWPPRRTLGSVLTHWQRAGYNMARVRLCYADLFKTPSLVRSEIWLLILSPLVSLYVTARIFLPDRHLWPYFHTVPVVYLTKLAWCLGAARRARYERALNVSA